MRAGLVAAVWALLCLTAAAQQIPHMHDGSAATLQAVIDYYDRGGNRHELLDPEVHPLGLSADEKSQLHAFLLSLSGRIQEGA